MLNITRNTIGFISILALPCLAACDDQDDNPAASSLDASNEAADGAVPLPADSAASEEPVTGCSRGTLESDFEAPPLAGPAVVDGALPPGEYLFSSTYLQLRQEPAAQMRFGQLMQPIIAQLETQPGLLAISFGTTRSCGAARTFAVWRDDIAMVGFVSSDAHIAAMTAVKEISRGGSVVTHWIGDETEANWQVASEQIGLDEGPFH